MSMVSPTSTSAEPPSDEVLLPAFLAKRADGVFVDPARIPDGEEFFRFVDRLFASGSRFSGLDYACFAGMLHDPAAQAATGKELRLAADIVSFEPQRRALYKGVKIDGKGERAAYVFEPVTLEVEYEEPVYGAPGENGVAPAVGHVRKTRQQPTRLDFDEFVADMWQKGLRFGIAANVVRQAMESGQAGRLDIAFHLAPVPGRDAEIQEVSDKLHRDDSPKVLASGKTDLRSFKNRFPQIEKDAPLLRKIPCERGKPGRKVTGEIVEPAVPQDIDLQVLVAPGTRIERRDGLEYIVSCMEGFLMRDTASNQISVTEKIESKEGVSSRSTGDLVLSVDEFVEHGEVQEGRVVRGRHMTFRADVYGDIVSQDGDIQIDSNLSGGSAKSVGGGVSVQGRASSAVIEAWDGKVIVGYAESCIMVGKSVQVERAVNCEIVAEHVQAGVIEGCFLAGKSISVASSGPRKNIETVISLLVPDISIFDRQLESVRAGATEIADALAASTKKMETLKAEPEFAKYLALHARIRQGGIQLSDEQQGNWRMMTARFAEPIKQFSALNAACQTLQKRLEESGRELDRIARERRGVSAGLYCRIAEVVGDTVVRRLVCNAGVAAFRDLPASELRSRLRNSGTPQERIFSGDAGSLDWQYLTELSAGT